MKVFKVVQSHKSYYIFVVGQVLVYEL